MLIEAGANETAVVVVSFTTVIVLEAVGSVLRIVASLPYVPLTVAEPGATPVNAAVQVPDAPSVQLAATVPTAVFDDVKDRKSVVKGKRVDLGGRGIIKKKKTDVKIEEEAHTQAGE